MASYIMFKYIPASLASREIDWIRVSLAFFVLLLSPYFFYFLLTEDTSAFCM